MDQYNGGNWDPNGTGGGNNFGYDNNGGYNGNGQSNDYGQNNSYDNSQYTGGYGVGDYGNNPSQRPNDLRQEAKRKNGLTSMILGIISLLINPFAILSILAIVYAVKSGKADGSGKMDGKGVAGLVCGIIGVVWFVINFINTMTRIITTMSFTCIF